MTQHNLITVIQHPGRNLHHALFPGGLAEHIFGLHPGPGHVVILLDHAAEVNLVDVVAPGEGQHAPT